MISEEYTHTTDTTNKISSYFSLRSLHFVFPVVYTEGMWKSVKQNFVTSVIVAFAIITTTKRIVDYIVLVNLKYAEKQLLLIFKASLLFKLKICL